VINFLRPGTGAVAIALVLTACGSSSNHASHPPGAQCTQAKAATHQTALLIGPFAGVTSRRELAAAERRLSWVARKMMTANGGSFYSYLVSTGNANGPLSRELSVLAADQRAYWAAWTAYRRSGTDLRAVGTAASKTMRDIRAISTACSTSPRS
jgi:hypothetical protein